jgi:hypothetical protein
MYIQLQLHNKAAISKCNIEVLLMKDPRINPWYVRAIIYIHSGHGAPACHLQPVCCVYSYYYMYIRVFFIYFNIIHIRLSLVPHPRRPDGHAPGFLNYTSNFFFSDTAHDHGTRPQPTAGECRVSSVHNSSTQPDRRALLRGYSRNTHPGGIMKSTQV